MANDDASPAGRFVNAAIQLAVIAYAGYRLAHAHSTAGLIGWGLLAAFAAILFVVAIVGPRLNSPEEAGADIEDLQAKLYAGVHARRVVDANEIDRLRLDARFYRDETANLERIGFRHVVDYIDETAVAAMPGTRAVLRGFVARDAQTMAAVYDLRFGGFMRLLQIVRLLPGDLRCVEFEAELDDGTFVCTSNAFQASKASDFPGISRRFLPSRAPTEDVWRAHQAHLTEMLASKPGVAPIAFRDVGECFASQDRMELMKSKHRNSPAFDPAAEIERVAGRPLRASERPMADAASRRHAERIAQREHETRDA